MEEKLRNAKAHFNYAVDIDKFKRGVFQKIENSQQRKHTSFLVAYKRFALIALILIILPTAAFAGYYYFGDQIFGSITNFINLGGEEKWYEGFESDLQFAQELLDEKEFERFLSLVKEIAPLHLKIAVEHDGNPNLLSKEEFLKYEQLNRELQPYYKKIDEATMKQIESEVAPTIPEHCHNQVSFQIVTPSYMPKGYSFASAHWGYEIEMKFLNGSDVITTLQAEIKDSKISMPVNYEKVYEYSLEGFQAKYGEGKKYNGIMVLMPETETHKASQIYITGKISKEELEKIALSMLTE